jgi:putative ABC transport system substrate-binding protein
MATSIGSTLTLVERKANSPFQQPRKFEFVINLKTGKALGLDGPLALIIRADETIE